MHAASPTNQHPGRGYWMRINVNEAVPGVATPLSADLWSYANEPAVTRMFRDMWLISRKEKRAMESGEEGALAPVRSCFFYGRCATDLDAFGPILGRMPGLDVESWEQQLLGVGRARTIAPARLHRQVLAAVRLSWLLIVAPRRVDRATAEWRAWWSARVLASSTADLEGCLRIFADAREHLVRAIALHTLTTSFQNGLIDALRRATSKLDAQGDADRLVVGLANLEEGDVMLRLWAVAHDGESLEDFVKQFGFYGLEEGELSSLTYRESPPDLQAAIDGYRSFDDALNPANRLAERAAAHRLQREAVSARASLGRRFLLNALVRRAARFSELRTLGKSLTQMSIDAARAAARRAGTLLVADGLIDSVDDVFYLTFDELNAARSMPDLRRLVRSRRELRECYQSLDLPLVFVGDDLTALVDAQLDASRGTTEPTPSIGSPLAGAPASEGVVTGVARVIADPSDAGDFTPGQVLVCPTTDPGWVLLISMSAGLVVEIGSAMSHAALLARELGIPCVAGVEDATRRIPDGALVEIDGSAGTVRIVTETTSSSVGDA